MICLIHGWEIVTLRGEVYVMVVIPLKLAPLPPRWRRLSVDTLNTFPTGSHPLPSTPVNQNYIVGLFPLSANLTCVLFVNYQEVLSADGLQPEFSFLCGHLLGALMERVEEQVNVQGVSSCCTDATCWCTGGYL